MSNPGAPGRREGFLLSEHSGFLPLVLSFPFVSFCSVSPEADVSRLGVEKMTRGPQAWVSKAGEKGQACAELSKEGEQLSLGSTWWQ